MNERIKELALKSAGTKKYVPPVWQFYDDELEAFAKAIIQDCIDKIETYHIPVGNSASGEMACEWTYDALKKIRGDIKEHFQF